MRKNRVWLHSLLLATFFAALMTACGGSSVDDAPPPPAQTGDTTLFANASLLASATTLETERVVILDARDTGYASGHIPGAIWVNDPDDPLLSIGSDGLPLVAELAQKLGARGIARTDKIVVYDDKASLGNAARLFWMLEYLGCTDVSLLNGGWDQWKIWDRPVQTEIPPARPPTTFTPQTNEQINLTKEEIVADPALVIVDLRLVEEYNGTVTTLGVLRPGHIAGATNIPFYRFYYLEDRTVMSYLELKKLLADHGIDKETKVVSYSTIGKRSTIFYFAARLMGYGNVYDYPGSINDWSKADPGIYPMETN